MFLSRSITAGTLLTKLLRTSVTEVSTRGAFKSYPKFDRRWTPDCGIPYLMTPSTTIKRAQNSVIRCQSTRLRMDRVVIFLLHRIIPAMVSEENSLGILVKNSPTSTTASISALPDCLKSYLGQPSPD